MNREYRIAVIGLDTSHATAFAGLMQDPASQFRVSGMRAVRCFGFETPFQNADGIAQRMKYMESIGVRPASSFDEAVEDCDAVFLEVNDPALHREYFQKAAGLGKPVFLDKPFADTVEHTREILRCAAENRTRFFTASSLRFTEALEQSMTDVSAMQQNAVVWGPVGQAPSGSSIIWYGVHAVEIFQRVMGYGAECVSTAETPEGYFAEVSYRDGRCGVIQLSRDCWEYGALLQDQEKRKKTVEIPYEPPFYYFLLQKILDFLKTGKTPVTPEESFEVMAILEALDCSAAAGVPCKVKALDRAEEVRITGDDDCFQPLIHLERGKRGSLTGHGGKAEARNGEV